MNYISGKVWLCVCGVCSLKRPSQTDTEPQTCLGSRGLTATRLPCVLCDRSARWLPARGDGRGRNVPPGTDYIIRRALCKMEESPLFLYASTQLPFCVVLRPLTPDPGAHGFIPGPALTPMVPLGPFTATCALRPRRPVCGTERVLDLLSCPAAAWGRLLPESRRGRVPLGIWGHGSRIGPKGQLAQGAPLTREARERVGLSPRLPSREEGFQTLHGRGCGL